MASAGGSSNSKKNKKKRHSAPVVSSANTISYGPPPPPQTGVYPAMPGYPMQPGLYAPEGYPIQAPGVYPAPVPAGGVPRMAVSATPMMPPPQRPQQPQQQPPQQKQLDFAQAMTDFKGMFPNMDLDVIETVLRSNSGKVDETIDQLLKLNADMPETAPRPPQPVMLPSTGIPVPPSQLPPGMFSSGGFLDEPPPYSPPEADSPFSRFNSNTTPQSNTATPVPRSRDASTTLQRNPPQPPASRRTRSLGGEESVSSAARENYRNVMQRMEDLQTSREWNPPMVGNLPTDFLRLSVSGGGDSPLTTPSPSTPTSQLGVAPGIRQRLDENTNRRRLVSQNSAESNQMLEDEKMALMLQNEEFLRQLQQDPEFLSALERDYHESLREGRTTSNIAPTTAATSTPSPISLPPISPPPRPSQAPVHRQPPPDLANRPLPATPGPDLPARPPGMKRESNGSSLPSSSAGGSRGVTKGATNASGGLSVTDIEFRNKLNHMQKSSKTKLYQQLGRFQKKKKASKKYETGEGGANDALLGGESFYEELNDNELSHEVRKSSKKRQSFGRQRSLLSYEECDPNFFSR